MSFVSIVEILKAMQEALAEIPHPTDPAQKLFQRVDFHENKKLAEAMKQLLITEDRIAVIVPGGHSFQNLQEGRKKRSIRMTTFELCIADRAWTTLANEALMGNDQNIGVLTMAEIVVNYFIEHPQLDLPWITLVPTEGAQITIADNEVKDTPGRECFVLGYETPSGQRLIDPTDPWSDSEFPV